MENDAQIRLQHAEHQGQLLCDKPADIWSSGVQQLPPQVLTFSLVWGNVYIVGHCVIDKKEVIVCVCVCVCVGGGGRCGATPLLKTVQRGVNKLEHDELAERL